MCSVCSLYSNVWPAFLMEGVKISSKISSVRSPTEPKKLSMSYKRNYNSEVLHAKHLYDQYLQHKFDMFENGSLFDLVSSRFHVRLVFNITKYNFIPWLTVRL